MKVICMVKSTDEYLELYGDEEYQISEYSYDPYESYDWEC